MRIDRENYGLYMIDFLEGKLDKEAVSVLMRFLDENPDLREELELLAEPAEEVFDFDNTELEDKEFLKKPLYHEISEDLNQELIAKLEGDLNKDELVALSRKFHLYPELNKDWDLVLKTKIEPDLSIVYPGKSVLYKKVPMVARIRFVHYAAAASVLIACGLFILRPQPAYTGLAITETNPVSFKFELPTENPTDVINLKVENKKLNAVTNSGSIVVADLTPDMIKPLQPGVKTYEFSKPELNANIDHPLAVKAGILREPVAANEHEFPTLADIFKRKLRKSTDEIVVEENGTVRDSKTQFHALVVRAFNKITGKDLRIRKKYDDEGNTIGYGIVSADFEFYNGK